MRITFKITFNLLCLLACKLFKIEIDDLQRHTVSFLIWIFFILQTKCFLLIKTWYRHNWTDKSPSKDWSFPLFYRLWSYTFIHKLEKPQCLFKDLCFHVLTHISSVQVSIYKTHTSVSLLTQVCDADDVQLSAAAARQCFVFCFWLRLAEKSKQHPPLSQLQPSLT